MRRVRNSQVDTSDWGSLTVASKWNRIRHAVYKRDGNRCQVCKRICLLQLNTVSGKPSRHRLQRVCHHLSWRSGELIPDTSLYITLCSSCHAKLPRPYLPASESMSIGGKSHTDLVSEAAKEERYRAYKEGRLHDFTQNSVYRERRSNDT